MAGQPESMPIVIKTRREIEQMRRAGQVACKVLELMCQAVKPGITTGELNEIARQELERHGAVGLSKNYPTYKPGQGYPAETCISVNEEVVHGIPGTRVLHDGDIVTVDAATGLSGYCADSAVTVAVGKISPAKQKLLDITRQSLDLAIENIKPGRKWSDIARLMQAMIEKAGFSVVREFVGHGIGRTMHEDPKVANFVSHEQMRSDFILRPGMTLAIEPMVVMGRRQVNMLSDGWTVVTRDGQPAAHFEHTVAVTDAGADVLTDGRLV